MAIGHGQCRTNTQRQGTDPTHTGSIKSSPFNILNSHIFNIHPSPNNTNNKPHPATNQSVTAPDIKHNPSSSIPATNAATNSPTISPTNSTLPPHDNPNSEINPARTKATRQLTNMSTGEVMEVTPEASARYRTTLKMDGLIEWGTISNCSFYFLTVTFAPRPGLNRKLIAQMRDAERKKFTARLKRIFTEAHLPFMYIWVLSLQLERYLGGDSMATPYHFLISCPAGKLPNQQPFIDKLGRKRWKTLDDSHFLSVKRLASLWVDANGNNLGTVNCGIVRSLPATRAYILINEQQAEAHHIRRSRRFGGSLLGLHSASKGQKRLVKAVREAHPDLHFNSISRKNGVFTMRAIADGRILHEEIIRSPWTTDPEKWLERQKGKDSFSASPQPKADSPVVDAVQADSSTILNTIPNSIFPPDDGTFSASRTVNDISMSQRTSDIPSVPADIRNQLRALARIERYAKSRRS